MSDEHLICTVLWSSAFTFVLWNSMKWGRKCILMKWTFLVKIKQKGKKIFPTNHKFMLARKGSLAAMQYVTHRTFPFQFYGKGLWDLDRIFMYISRDIFVFRINRISRIKNYFVPSIPMPVWTSHFGLLNGISFFTCNRWNWPHFERGAEKREREKSQMSLFFSLI